MITRDEIIRMATQAGWQMPAEWDGFDGFSCRLERFARAAYEAGAEAECEALRADAERWKGVLSEVMDALDGKRPTEIEWSDIRDMARAARAVLKEAK